MQGYSSGGQTFETLQELIRSIPECRRPLNQHVFKDQDFLNCCGGISVSRDKYVVALKNLTKVLFATLPQPIAEELAEHAFVWCD
jgi:hypothetical protein